MRLLKREASGWVTTTYTFSLVECDSQNVAYAILSHRWGPDEVTFKDIENGTARQKAGGYKKLEFCAQQAARDGLLYFWVDTCCIDKSNSTELSEAINSMFQWYRNATKCYVYLPDVSAGPEWEAAFSHSEWFDRGWTLQELIAPQVVEFFSVDGIKLADKKSIEHQIHQISGVSVKALRGTPLSHIDESERFSWTARRKTTKPEDMAYCLLGIFDVQMPLVYGEGQQKALTRLQREIRSLADPRVHTIKDATWIVPFQRNPLFTGREAQLAELEDRLFAKDRISKIAITGLGGVGKTQLLLELLYRTRTKHPGCSIIWIAATTMESLQQGYLAVARQLEIPGYDNDEINVTQLVQDYLSRHDSGEWLLVFDNADDIDMWTTPLSMLKGGDEDGNGQRPSTKARRLIDYLPKSPKGRTVFTTRNRKAAVKLAQANIVLVPEMSEEMATDLLKKTLITTDSVDYLENVSILLVALTYLPLAIAQAAAYINANGTTLADYVSLLRRPEAEAIDLLSEDFEDEGRYQETKNPIAITWLISFERIQQSDPLAAEYLSFIACVNPKDIPQSLLPPGPSRKKELDAIGTLSAYSLITWRSADAALDVHRLVHLTTRNWLRQADALSRRMEETIIHINDVFPDNDHRNRGTWRLYLPHVIHLLGSDLINKSHKKRVSLMQKCGTCLYSDGRWNEAEAMFTEVVAATTKIHGEKSLFVLKSIAWLSSTYWNQGRLSEAEELDIQVMETRKTKLGLDHPDTLSSIANLASTYWNQGRWSEAEELEVQVMETRKTKLGVDHPDTLSSIANLASTYWNQGRWSEAEQLELQVMETRKTKLGLDHPDTLSSIADLASIYRNQGRWSEAEQLEVPVMETCKTKLGLDHPDTLLSIANLASTYWNQGRWSEAEELDIQVMETRKTKLGVDHPDTLMSMNNLAITWKDMGRDLEALRLLEDCVRQRILILGAEHPYTKSSLARLNSWQA